ncbi:MAG: hypothetical protein ACREEO_06185 [Phenylobacterium sp.]
MATCLIRPSSQSIAPRSPLRLRPADLFSYDASGWDLGAGLTAPLFNGGALMARRQQAREAATGGGD